MQNRKRILSVTVKRIIDESPDTSHLGEYANRPNSEFSIDRAHSEDCASVLPSVRDAKKTLEHVQQTIGDLHNDVLAQYNGTLANEKLDSEKDALDEAYDTIGELIDSVGECDCGERGDMARHEFRYFNPSFNYVDKNGNPSDGLTSEEVRKYTRQDYERMESLNRGDWCFIGIIAEAEIQLTTTWENSVVSKVSWHSPIAPYQTITSGGLWGTESDSDESYLQEIEQEQLSELRSQLKALGFSSRAISAAFKNVERKDS